MATTRSASSFATQVPPPTNCTEKLHDTQNVHQIDVACFRLIASVSHKHFCVLEGGNASADPCCSLAR